MINKLHMAMIGLYHGDAKRIQHFCKVHSYAKLIAEMENVDAKTLFILETAALTHDIGIHLCEEKYFFRRSFRAGTVSDRPSSYLQ